MDTMVGVATFGLLLLCWYLLKMALKRAKMVHLVDKLPGPRAYPVIGTSWKLLTFPRNQLMAQAKKDVTEFGPLFRTWIGPIPEVHLMKPQHFELLLGSPKHIDKSLSYKFLHPWLGTGLLTSTGAKWHSHRKMITPTFHFKILENFQEVFVEKSEIMLEKLRPHAHGRVFDIYPFITRCALDIICETAMGTQINAQEDTDSAYVKAVYDITEATFNRAISPWLHPNFIFQRTKMGRRYKECIGQLHGFTNKVIQEKKSLLAGATRTTNKSSDEDSSIGKKKRRAFLDLLLEVSLQEGGLSDEEIREEVDTFMFEGHDTTAAGMSWTIFLLGIHPEIQVRVQQELDEIFQGLSRAATMRDVQEMKYLEQVIKESLRLYPSVPFIQRHLNQDIQLDEYLIPAGTMLTFEIFFAHRNPKYFPNPDQFDPDNFRLENIQARHPYAYIPFSAGPRNCIGQKFALQEEKTILSYLFRHYSVRCLDKMEDVILLGELVLRPENGIRVVLTPRDKA